MFLACARILPMKTISSLKRKTKKVPFLRNKGVLNARVREFRHEHGLTLRDVAKASGVALATLNRMEFGCEVELTSALMVAKFFETTVNDLFSLR